MTPDDVFDLRKRYWTNGYRPLEVWSPDQQVNDKGEALNSPGKQPRGRWRESAAQPPPAAARNRPDGRALNTGLLTDQLPAFDIDVLDQDLADQIVHLIEATLGPTPLVRIGKAPKILLAYRSEHPFSKIETAEFFLPNGSKAQVEVLAQGQQFVAAGVHPDTGQPYVWTDGTPETVPLGELPVVTEGQARTVIVEAERLLREAGAREKKRARREPHAPTAQKPNGSGGDFFKEVNRAALANLTAWARALFPRARFEPGTGAWRVSSKDLNRDLEEDLSIHPDGIWDFGEEVALSAVDLTLKYSGVAKPLEAALWLCERLDIEPLTLGHSHAQRQQQQKTTATSERTIQVVTGKRHEAADAGIAAMHAAGVAFYQRDRNLVRVCDVKAKSTNSEIILVPGIATVTPAILDRALGQVAQWQRFDPKRGAPVPIDPPRLVVSQILDMVGEWPFLPLAGVIGCPTLRPDGSLLSVEGYDTATGLVLKSAVAMPTILDHPTRRDAEAAAALLSELLDEFPFANDASKAVALSMLLTPVLRGAMAAAPMHLVTAPQPGTGKSYLADTASMIATGERVAVVAVAPDEAETEKRLIGCALAGFPIIGLDNCRETLQGDFLCQVTERPLLQLRALGKSDKIRIPNVFTTFANGNNLAVADDLVRRTICCALDANVENPECRTFRFDPLDAVRRARGVYVAACITIARAFIAAGKPKRLPPLPSYEAWSDLVRSALIWLDFADPLNTMAAARGADPVRQDRAAVFTAWREELDVDQQYLAAEITEHAVAQSGYDGSFVRPALRTALLAIAAQRGNAAQIDARRLGIWLKNNENTIIDRHKLTADRGDATRPRWKLVQHRWCWPCRRCGSSTLAIRGYAGVCVYRTAIQTPTSHTSPTTPPPDGRLMGCT